MNWNTPAKRMNNHFMPPIYPLCVQSTKYRTFDQNFNFNLRKNPQKIFYERRAYESVDERSISTFFSSFFGTWPKIGSFRLQTHSLDARRKIF